MGAGLEFSSRIVMCWWLGIGPGLWALRWNNWPWIVYSQRAWSYKTSRRVGPSSRSVTGVHTKCDFSHLHLALPEITPLLPLGDKQLQNVNELQWQKLTPWWHHLPSTAWLSSAQVSLLCVLCWWNSHHLEPCQAACRRRKETMRTVKWLWKFLLDIGCWASHWWWRWHFDDFRFEIQE